MLRAHTLKPFRGAKHSHKKLGRGNASGHGTSSTRGGKGQTARSGGSRGLHLRAFKDLMQSAPKLGGFKSIHAKPVEITLAKLEKAFNAGETVSLATLKEKKLISKNAADAKILNTGELTKKLVVEGVKVTKTVAEKIKTLGGEIK